MVLSKRIRRHLRLAVVGSLLVVGFYFALGLSPELWVDVGALKASSVKWRASVSFAYAALLLFALTLAIGPYDALRNRPSPANNLLRRDIAIWGGAFALAHVLIALFVHVRGLRVWQNFFTAWPSPDNPLPLKLSKIGLANYLGLLQVAIVVLLLGLSNNVSVRKLGTRRWKNLQRLNYVAFASIVAHAFLYHLVEQRLIGFRLPVYLVFVFVITLQAFGYRRVIRRRRSRRESA